MDEQDIANPGSLVIAKALSLIAVLVVIFSGLHQIFGWTIFEAETADLAFKAGLVLMLIAMAFNGHARPQANRTESSENHS